MDELESHRQHELCLWMISNWPYKLSNAHYEGNNQFQIEFVHEESLQDIYYQKKIVANVNSSRPCYYYSIVLRIKPPMTISIVDGRIVLTHEDIIPNLPIKCIYFVQGSGLFLTRIEGVAYKEHLVKINDLAIAKQQIENNLNKKYGGFPLWKMVVSIGDFNEYLSTGAVARFCLKTKIQNIPFIEHPAEDIYQIAKKNGLEKTVITVLKKKYKLD